ARPQLSNPAGRVVLEQQGAFFREVPANAPRIAFVFAGQGSQYDGMLQQLTGDVPAAAKALAAWDASMTRLGYPSFAQLAWSKPSQLGTDVFARQLAKLA